MELIEFLESKNVSPMCIEKIMKTVFRRKDNIDFLDSINKIYEIMNYAGLNDEQIELLIYNNMSILNLKYDEIIKLAYVLMEVGLIDEIFEKPSIYSGRLLNYKRIFIRNLIAIHSKRYLRASAVSFLTDADINAYGEKYDLCYDAFKVFHKSIFADEEAEKEINKFLTINVPTHDSVQKKKVTVDEYIDIRSKVFYSSFLFYKHNKKYSTNKTNK